MAIANDALLYTKSDAFPPQEQFLALKTAQVTVAVSGIAADRTLPRGTAMAKVTSSGHYVPWNQGGSDGSQTIVGFLAPNEATQYGTDANTEGTAVIMIEGEIDYDVAFSTAAQAVYSGTVNTANFLAALNTSEIRKNNIVVRRDDAADVI